MVEFTPKIIDTHGHVNFNAFKDDGEEVIKRALEEGIGIIMPGSQIDTSKRAVEYAEKLNHPYIKAAIGLHPIHLEDIQVDDSEVEGQIKFRTRKEDFRREIMNYIGALAIEGKTFDYKMNERLHRALELKLFEDQKDSIKLTTIISKVVDKATQEKIEVVKTRLIKNQGYCEICATDALNFVASIFAKGDAIKS